MQFQLFILIIYFNLYLKLTARKVKSFQKWLTIWNKPTWCSIAEKRWDGWQSGQKYWLLASALNDAPCCWSGGIRNLESGGNIRDSTSRDDQLVLLTYCELKQSEKHWLSIYFLYAKRQVSHIDYLEFMLSASKNYIEINCMNLQGNINEKELYLLGVSVFLHWYTYVLHIYILREHGW